MKKRHTKRPLLPAVHTVRNFSLVCAGVSALAIVVNFLFLSLTPSLQPVHMSSVQPCNSLQSCQKNHGVEEKQTITSQKVIKPLLSKEQ